MAADLAFLAVGLAVPGGLIWGVVAGVVLELADVAIEWALGLIDTDDLVEEVAYAVAYGVIGGLTFSSLEIGLSATGATSTDELAEIVVGSLVTYLTDYLE